MQFFSKNLPWFGIFFVSLHRDMDTENVLFAIAGSESMKAGFGGAIYGYAANQQVLEHYVEKMKATHVGVLHPYQFCVFENEMQEIIKTYTYAYSGEEI